MDPEECANSLDADVIAMCIQQDVQGVYDMIVPIAQLGVLLAVIMTGVIFAKSVVREFGK